MIRMRANRTAPWRVIYIARGERQAQNIEDLLREAGFLVERKSCAGGDDHQEDIEIKALESEAEEARLYLMERGL